MCTSTGVDIMVVRLEVNSCELSGVTVWIMWTKTIGISCSGLGEKKEPTVEVIGVSKVQLHVVA